MALKPPPLRLLRSACSSASCTSFTSHILCISWSPSCASRSPSCMPPHPHTHTHAHALTNTHTHTAIHTATRAPVPVARLSPFPLLSPFLPPLPRASNSPSLSLNTHSAITAFHRRAELMRCRLARLGLLRRRRGELVEEDHGGVLMAEFRRRTRAEGVREKNCLYVHARTRACTRAQVPRCSPKCGTRTASSSRGLLGSSGTRAATATSRVNSLWLDRSRVQVSGLRGSTSAAAGAVCSVQATFNSLFRSMA